jgi:4-phospho-D-threonate 3-dehydrogenase / 4-phospho-D-erythronate 3-dehydrogenase
MSMSQAEIRPILALTMGDPVGVGPEIIVKTLADSQIYQVCRPLVLGDFPALERARLELSPAANIHLAERPGLGRYKAGTIDLMPLSELKPGDLEYGRPTRANGKATISYILKAIELALARQVAGMVTAPISKLSMNLSGYRYPGHTELLADKTGTPEVVMMLAGGEFRVILATIHCALAEVPGRLSPDGLLRLFRLVCQALAQDFGLAGAPLAVAALNPHAGEGGMFGREEEEIIIPAIKAAQAAGLPVEGPFPADTLFWRHRHGEFAGVVCMYHDQGLIPLKLLHFMDGVNVTLGLPIIRTSVDHGTAYDLAGTGQAAPDSLKAAISMAAAMAKRRFGEKE